MNEAEAGDGTRQLPLLANNILAAADDLLSDEQRWTQGAMARTADGKEIRFDDPLAVSFGVLGALRRAAHQLGFHILDFPINQAEAALFYAAYEVTLRPRPARVSLPSSRLWLLSLTDGLDREASYQLIRQIYAKALGIER